MRSVFCFFLVLGISHCGFAQQRILDSLRMQLINAKNEDTSKVLALSDLADYFGFVQANCCFGSDQIGCFGWCQIDCLHSDLAATVEQFVLPQMGDRFEFVFACKTRCPKIEQRSNIGTSFSQNLQEFQLSY